jgi:thiamine-monophosphate kinase
MGELKLIELLIETIGRRGHGRSVATGHRLKVAVGDDAAAWEAPGGIEILLNDVMVEAVHFDLETTGWRDLGWKCVAVNLSDVAAMGCVPGYAVVGLGLRGDLPVSGIIEMYEGMLDVSGEYGCSLVGGDVVQSPTFFVSVAMTGDAQVKETGGPVSQPVLTRDAARVGDLLAVTGHVGCSGGGLRMLREGLGFDEETTSHLRLAHIRPVPRLSEGVALARQGESAVIDVSDGLMDDLGKLCKASGVGAVVRSDRLPADGFLRRAYPNEWLSLALGGGEDYELLFAARAEIVEAVRPLIDTPVSVIGEIVPADSGVSVVDERGRSVKVQSGGWDHFRTD